MTQLAVRLALRAAFAASLFMFGTASSCDAGDRAAHGCPPGEVCDPATEDGLHFGGPIIGEGLLDPGDVKPVATGGRQTVALFEVDEDGHHVAFELPYDATFDSSAVEIEATTGNLVTLRGNTGSQGHLRIVSPDSGALFDRTTIAARSITDLRLGATFMVAVDGSTTYDLYAPGAEGYVELAGGDTRLVDEDAAIVGTAVTQTRWDRFVVGAVAPGAYSLTVTAGDHAPVDLAFEVAHADSLAHVFGDTIVRDGNKQMVCFTARSGARPIQVAWTFGIAGGTLEPTTFAGCTFVRAGAGDEVTVSAFADGLAASITLPVVESSSKRAPEHYHSNSYGRGDRAAQRLGSR